MSMHIFFALLSLHQLTRSVEKGQQRQRGQQWAGGACGPCIIIPIELCQQKKQTPVTHNAEREMANMQQKYNATVWVKEINSTSIFKVILKIWSFILKST